MSGCICDGSGFFMTPDADGESAYEVACPGPVHNQNRCPETADGEHMAFGSATTCQFCGTPDPGPSVATIRLTTPSTGKGTADLMAHGDGDSVMVGTVKAISAGFWEADLWRAHPLTGPQASAPGRGPMEHGLAALRAALEQAIQDEGPWWLLPRPELHP